MTRSYDVTNATGSTQSTVTVPFYSSTAANGGRIDPTGPVLTGFSDVNSWYHSMVITFKKRMTGGVELLTNYTLAKATDGGQAQGQFGTFNGTISALDPYNKKLEYGRSDLDQRQRFVASVIWIPQFTSKIKNTTAKAIADGWRFSTIVLINTGQPVTGTINGSPSGAVAGGLTGGVVNNSGTAQSASRFPGSARNAFTGSGTR